MVVQLKGLSHCKLIRKKAKQLWRKTHWQRGLWDQCLRAAMNSHRRECEMEIISKGVQKQLAFSSSMFCGE